MSELVFKATVATDGNTWDVRVRLIAATLDPLLWEPGRQVKYEVTDGDVQIEYRDGVVRRSMWGVDTLRDLSKTGTDLDRLLREEIDRHFRDAQYFRQTVPHVYMRLAEMYLIAAEASMN
jgi:hypothetical protein